jgi:hypothetical protein
MFFADGARYTLAASESDATSVARRASRCSTPEFGCPETGELRIVQLRKFRSDLLLRDGGVHEVRWVLTLKRASMGSDFRNLV